MLRAWILGLSATVASLLLESSALCFLVFLGGDEIEDISSLRRTWDFSEDGLEVADFNFVFGVSCSSASLEVERIEVLLLRDLDLEVVVLLLRDRGADLERLREEEDDGFVIDVDGDFFLAALIADALPADSFFFRVGVPGSEGLALDFVIDAFFLEEALVDLRDEVLDDLRDDDDFFLRAWESDDAFFFLSTLEARAFFSDVDAIVARSLRFRKLDRWFGWYEHGIMEIMITE